MGMILCMRTLPAGFIAPCLPTKTDKLPSGSQWLHEIKHDGFRVIARKNGPRVRGRQTMAIHLDWGFVASPTLCWSRTSLLPDAWNQLASCGRMACCAHDQRSHHCRPF